MTQKQQAFITQLHHYVTENGWQIIGEKAIDYGYQFRLSDGLDTCMVTVYESGKVVIGGKKTAFSQQIEEWKNLQLATGPGIVSSLASEGSSNRSTKYIVTPEKYDKIRATIAAIPAEIKWHEGGDGRPYVYYAEIHANGEKVVVTQYSTGTLRVQGKTSFLFDEVCHQLDQKLVQSAADRATRYIPEAQRVATLAQMEQPEAETEAWTWLNGYIGQNLFHFLDKHDQATLISGAMLLRAVKSLNLPLPDYSTLVMPFARAYEGFLIKLFTNIGLADSIRISQSVQAIQVGKWLDQLPDLIVDLRRHGHIVSDLKTAWEGTRHLMIHSDPVRQKSIPDLTKAEHEICGVLMRAFERGYDCFVGQPIALKSAVDTDKSTSLPATQSSMSSQPGSLSREKNAITIIGLDEAKLLTRLRAAGYTVEQYDDPTMSNKWRVTTETLKAFCPREPGDKIVIRGQDREAFAQWCQNEAKADAPFPATVSSFVSHIGADEAGKGDYFGPLVVATVYVTSETALDLIRWGVKDSKTLSDTTIAGLATKIRTCCPHLVHILMPPEYNEAYQRHQNLNLLLAELHATIIGKLVIQTGCYEVLVDQFAAPEVLAKAVAQQGDKINLMQRSQGESDVAVAAASILARDGFVATMADYRLKTGLEIPLGSSPQAIEIGQAIVRKWGAKGLERIAKLNFSLTQKILGE